MGHLNNVRNHLKTITFLYPTSLTLAQSPILSSCAGSFPTLLCSPSCWLYFSKTNLSLDPSKALSMDPGCQTAQHDTPALHILTPGTRPTSHHVPSAQNLLFPTMSFFLGLRALHLLLPLSAPSISLWSSTLLRPRFP